jgi:FtsP/CotA-like multicopper oxidase with cupredoxin domain
MVFASLLALALQQPSLPDPPTARSPVTLTAATADEGQDEYVYDGRPVAPVIRVRPGERLTVTLVNAMTVPSRETCVMDPCMQATNFHFHGMHVSPTGAADNVLGMLAMPGDTLRYAVDIPRDHPSGLYWYHPHPHGESDRQIDDGMSGAIVVDGINREVPAVRGLRERILVFRAPHHAWTINGIARPAIDIAPGERQFWRIVNASGDNFLDLAIDGRSWDVVALDGAVVPTRRMVHVPIPPGGRSPISSSGPGRRLRLQSWRDCTYLCRPRRVRRCTHQRRRP